MGNSLEFNISGWIRGRVSLDEIVSNRDVGSTGVHVDDLLPWEFVDGIEERLELYMSEVFPIKVGL